MKCPYLTLNPFFFVRFIEPLGRSDSSQVVDTSHAEASLKAIIIFEFHAIKVIIMEPISVLIANWAKIM